MGDATYPIFNNHMFIIIKIKAYGGGGGIINASDLCLCKSITYIQTASHSGIHFGIQSIKNKYTSGYAN